MMKKIKSLKKYATFIGILINYLLQNEIQVVKMMCIVYGAYATEAILK